MRGKGKDEEKRRKGHNRGSVREVDAIEERVKGRLVKKEQKMKVKRERQRKG